MLSGRFVDLINELKLDEALWHLQRTNAGSDKDSGKKIITATNAEIIAGYRTIMGLIENNSGRVNNILDAARNTLGEMPDKKTLETQRDVRYEIITNRKNQSANHDHYAIADDSEYGDILSEIRRLRDLEILIRNATGILMGQGVPTDDDIKESISYLSRNSEIDEETLLEALGLVEKEEAA